jgi:hypothetical protein
MRRYFCLVCIFLFLALGALPAQDAGPAVSGGGGGEESGEASGQSDAMFPIHILTQTAAGGQIEWRPDWPANMPVDAFSVLNGGGGSRVSAVSLNGGEIRLTARRNGRGILSEFPVFLNGGFYQFTTNFDAAGKIRGFTRGGEEPVEIELLAFENLGGEPSLARIHDGESWFFASILYQDALILETWYDADGNPLAVFTAEAAGGRPKLYRSVFQALPDGADEEPAAPASQAASPLVPALPAAESRLYFDGMGNTTRVDTGEDVFEALYNASGPRYWKRPELGHVALQWDGPGHLVRMAGFAEDDAPLDFRYEYDFDGQGSWTERREFRVTAELGVLIPRPGDSFSRTIEYR